MSKIILVADDSRTIQIAVSMTLRATPFKVVSAADGDEAMRKIGEAKPDLVLLDVAMPGKNGYELCSQLKSSASTADIPVILLTGAEPVDERRVSEARADGHIKKPFDSQALIERVTSMTASHTPSGVGTKPSGSNPNLPPDDRLPPHMPQLRPSMSPSAPPVRVASSPGVAPRPVAMPPTTAGLVAPASMGPVNGGPVSSSASGGLAEQTPFGAPRAEMRHVSVESPASSTSTSTWRSPDEGEPSGDDSFEIVESPVGEFEEFADGDEEEAQRLPSLEPPRAPSASAGAARPHVDVWALADEAQPGHRPPKASMNDLAEADPGAATHTDSLEIVEPQAPDPVEEIEIFDAATPNGSEGLASVAAVVTEKAAVPLAVAVAQQVPGLAHDELVRIAKEVIERIAWEVVPELAETIIRAELERLTKD